MTKIAKDLTGVVFNGIVVLKRDYERQKSDKYNAIFWECACHCGSKFITTGKNLKSGNTKSCGCLKGSKGKTKNGKVNEWRFIDNLAIGKAHDGREFTIEKSDYERVKMYRWRFDKHGYVCANSKDTTNRVIKMHRIITFAKKNDIVDHINWDKSNNTKGNLRLCSKSDNNVNIKRRSDNRSGYTGVRQVVSGKWIAVISFQNTKHHLGTFEKLEDAVRARSMAEKHIHKEFNGEINRNDLNNFVMEEQEGIDE